MTPEQWNWIYDSFTTEVSWRARQMKATLEHGELGTEIPQEVLGAAHDLNDYLDGTRPTPEFNRNGIPDARD